MNKVLMTGLLSLSIVAPVAAQVGPGANWSDHVGQGGAAQYATVCTNSRNGRLSLRTGPGQNFPKIKEIRNGNQIALIVADYGSDGFRWWNVLHNGSRGWVRADYVCGDPD